MSKATRIVAAVMLIGVLAALLPACGAGPTPTIPPPYQAQPSFTPEPTAPPEPTAVPPTPTPEPPTAVPGNTTGVTDTTIKLGSFAALSGPVAPIGIPCSHGYLAYYQWVNDQGGINGRKIDITVEDDAFDPSKTVAATKKLVEQDQVFAIVSPLGTPGNMAVMQYLVDNNIPVFCPHSGASAWAFPLKPNYFALQPNYTVEGRTLAQYAVNVLGAEKIALFHVNDDFGNEEANAFKSELAKMGKGTIVAEVAHEGTDTDFSSYAIKLQEANPDLVVLSSYLAGAAGVLKESELLAFKPMWLASYVISDPVIVTVAGASAMEGYRVFGYAAAPPRCAGRSRVPGHSTQVLPG
jgi:branched-chain amino acid transport system substrate-binding protein